MCCNLPCYPWSALHHKYLFIKNKHRVPYIYVHYIKHCPQVQLTVHKRFVSNNNCIQLSGPLFLNDFVLFIEVVIDFYLQNIDLKLPFALHIGKWLSIDYSMGSIVTSDTIKRDTGRFLVNMALNCNTQVKHFAK